MKKIHIIGYITVAVVAYNIGLEVQHDRTKKSLGDVMPEVMAVQRAASKVEKYVDEGRYEDGNFDKMHDDFEFEIIAEMESEK